MISAGILSIVIYVKHGANLLKTLCILDTGASQSTIDEDFARHLGLPFDNERKKTLAYLDRQVTINTSVCQVEVVSQDHESSYNRERILKELPPLGLVGLHWEPSTSEEYSGPKMPVSSDRHYSDRG